MPLHLGATVTLPDDARHYAVDVRRLTTGDSLEVFGTEGTAFDAVIATLDPFTVTLLHEIDGTANESPCRITLYQAIAKGDRFDWALEKSTELGVAQIVPIMTARSVVKIAEHKAATKTSRWQKICDGAARQSGRALSPTVAEPIALHRAAAGLRHPFELLLHPDADRSLSQLESLGDAVDVGIWIGPEGGFDDKELVALGARAQTVRCGPRTLRSETAGIVAIALVQGLTGGLD